MVLYKAMKKLDIYLDTSIWNYVYADDTPEKKEITLQFFREVEKGIHNINIGVTVLEEINRTKDEKKLRLLLDLIEKYKPTVLELTDEVKRLAKGYIREAVIPENKIDDAHHVAYATYYQVDVLLTWNYAHLAGVSRTNKVASLNLKEGYTKRLDLATPYEVISDES